MTTENTSSKPESNPEKNPSVAEGKKAIEAAKIANPAPEEKKEEAEKKDAEQWRNEG
ncbi:MAG: hypothetical protein H7Y03_10585 [Chitinophagaceae bacterium]|nr:hypothetical protein [Chitinophagaceae bacterium]